MKWDKQQRANSELHTKEVRRLLVELKNLRSSMKSNKIKVVDRIIGMVSNELNRIDLDGERTVPVDKLKLSQQMYSHTASVEDYELSRKLADILDRLLLVANMMQTTKVRNLRLLYDLMMTDATFMSGILSASPPLYSAMHRYFNVLTLRRNRSNGALVQSHKKLLLSVYEYYKKSYHKVSPFSTFCTWDIGVIEEPSFDVSSFISSPYHHVRFSNVSCSRMLKTLLHDSTIAQTFMFRVSDFLTEIGTGELCSIAANNYLPVRTQFHSSPLLEWLLRNKGRIFSGLELLSQLHLHEGNESVEQGHNTLLWLISNGVVVISSSYLVTTGQTYSTHLTTNTDQTGLLKSLRHRNSQFIDVLMGGEWKVESGSSLLELVSASQERVTALIKTELSNYKHSSSAMSQVEGSTHYYIDSLDCSLKKTSSLEIKLLSDVKNKLCENGELSVADALCQDVLEAYIGTKRITLMDLQLKVMKETASSRDHFINNIEIEQLPRAQKNVADVTWLETALATTINKKPSDPMMLYEYATQYLFKEVIKSFKADFLEQSIHNIVTHDADSILDALSGRLISNHGMISVYAQLTDQKNAVVINNVGESPLRSVSRMLPTHITESASNNRSIEPERVIDIHDWAISNVNIRDTRPQMTLDLTRKFGKDRSVGLSEITIAIEGERLVFRDLNDTAVTIQNNGLQNHHQRSFIHRVIAAPMTYKTQAYDLVMRIRLDAINVMAETHGVYCLAATVSKSKIYLRGVAAVRRSILEGVINDNSARDLSSKMISFINTECGLLGRSFIVRMQQYIVGEELVGNIDSYYKPWRVDFDSHLDCVMFGNRLRKAGKIVLIEELQPSGVPSKEYVI